MMFDRPWVLFIAWIPLAWLAWEWQKGRQRVSLSLKAASIVAILLALSEPRITTTETKMAISVLVDTSQSVSDADLKRASSIAN